MSTDNIEDASIDAFLDISFDQRSFQPVVSFLAAGEVLVLRIRGMVELKLSRPPEDRFLDASNVVEVSAVKQSWPLSQTDDAANPRAESPRIELTIITVIGDIGMEIVCDGFQIEYEPLAKRFPHIK